MRHDLDRLFALLSSDELFDDHDSMKVLYRLIRYTNTLKQETPNDMDDLLRTISLLMEHVYPEVIDILSNKIHKRIIYYKNMANKIRDDPVNFHPTKALQKLQMRSEIDRIINNNVDHMKLLHEKNAHGDILNNDIIYITSALSDMINAKNIVVKLLNRLHGFRLKPRSHRTLYIPVLQNITLERTISSYSIYSNQSVMNIMGVIQWFMKTAFVDRAGIKFQKKSIDAMDAMVSIKTIYPKHFDRYHHVTNALRQVIPLKMGISDIPTHNTQRSMILFIQRVMNDVLKMIRVKNYTSNIDQFVKTQLVIMRELIGNIRTVSYTKRVRFMDDTPDSHKRKRTGIMETRGSKRHRPSTFNPILNSLNSRMIKLRKALKRWLIKWKQFMASSSQLVGIDLGTKNVLELISFTNFSPEYANIRVSMGSGILDYSVWHTYLSIHHTHLMIIYIIDAIRLFYVI